jgi:hypothetical protein
MQYKAARRSTLLRCAKRSVLEDHEGRRCGVRDLLQGGALAGIAFFSNVPSLNQEVPSDKLIPWND